MANPRRNSTLFSPPNSQSLESPIQTQTQRRRLGFSFSNLNNFLQKPHAIPFLLSIFLILTWLFLRLQNASNLSSSSSSSSSSSALYHQESEKWRKDDDTKANLVRFQSGFPSTVTKDKRGWLLDPISLALRSGIPGGALTCASVHLGEIQPGSLRGNHRHHTCNETFVIWGAKTKFRLENNEVGDKGYAEVIIGSDEVAIAASPSGTAHALINMDHSRSTFFVGCQDSLIDYNSSTTDFSVWKDL